MGRGSGGIREGYTRGGVVEWQNGRENAERMKGVGKSTTYENRYRLKGCV